MPATSPHHVDGRLVFTLKDLLAFIAILCALPALAADKATEKPAPAENQELQGTWQIISGEANGKPAPEAAIKDIKWIIKDKTVTIQTADGPAVKLTLKLDPAQKIKAIDLTNSERKETIRGIYDLKKETLRLCLGAPGEDRPRAFATRDNLKVVLFVLKRIKS
jgi:uncharacterized protein (TIGR03067 family)